MHRVCTGYTHTIAVVIGYDSPREASQASRASRIVPREPHRDHRRSRRRGYDTQALWNTDPYSRVLVWGGGSNVTTGTYGARHDRI